MTQPDGLWPANTFNFDSLAAFAAKTEEDWRAEITALATNGLLNTRNGMFFGVPTGMPQALAIITAILRQLLQLPAQIWENAEDALAALAELVANQTANLLALLGIDINQASDLFDPLVAFFAGATKDGQEAWNAIVEAWQGLLGEFGVGEAKDAMIQAAHTLALNSAAIDALRAGSGMFAYVDFTVFPNSAQLPSSLFSQTYGGSGSSTYGVSGGAAQVGVVIDLGSRFSRARYTPAVTTGDTQVVCGVWSSKPQTNILGTKARVTLIGRWNTTTTFVFAHLTANSVDIGCVVSGTLTTLASTSAFSFKANTSYYLLLGTAAGSRRFEVREGSTTGALVLGVTDSGAVSVIGASNRSGGIGVTWEPGVPPILPGKMIYWALSDT